MTNTRRSIGLAILLMAAVSTADPGCSGKKSPGATAIADNKLVIAKATWSDVRDEKTADVTKIIEGLVKDNALTVVPSDRILGDPASFKVKHLRVEWSKGGVMDHKHAMEGETLTIGANEKPVPVRLVITKATYGGVGSGKTIDVTKHVAERIVNNKVSLIPGNAIFGDPSPGQAKQLHVDYTFDGAAKNKIVDEFQPLNIP